MSCLGVAPSGSICPGKQYKGEHLPRNALKLRYTRLNPYQFTWVLSIYLAVVDRIPDPIELVLFGGHSKAFVCKTLGRTAKTHPQRMFRSARHSRFKYLVCPLNKIERRRTSSFTEQFRNL